MGLKRRDFNKVLLAAVGGIVAGTTVGCSSNDKQAASSASLAHECQGKNECRGMGGCKSGDNGCKGKNSCKGKGGCAVSEEEMATLQEANKATSQPSDSDQ